MDTAGYARDVLINIQDGRHNLSGERISKARFGQAEAEILCLALSDGLSAF